ncbi:MAG TPA: LamG-like jellyroll fold domain-containing protein [Verrucomicrobiae bacterium]|jgi:hypothetical protein|nr:LamG-like jellyroll fold domain-containing protein [Verrucomicrobiae bacterium]
MNPSVFIAMLCGIMIKRRGALLYLKFPALCLLVLITTVQAGAWQMKQAPLMTQWAALVDTNNPLPEYPRPQMVRSNWLNLNGIWQFQPGATNDSVPTGVTLSNQILVPYPMESAISGVMHYYEFSWYRRTFTVPSTWSGKKIILHLDAVDWRATVYVNGQQVGVHSGGYDPFSYDITPYLNAGSNELIIGVYSPVDNGGQPRGKQTLYPGGIMYTSSSGIWQPAWLEPVDAFGINNLQIVPDVDDSQLRLTANCYTTAGVTVNATVLSNGVPVATLTGNPQTEMDIPVPTPNLWSPDHPFLYGLQISTVHNGVTNDSVTSYFGMRKISISVVNGVPQMFLNNKPYFEMGPLDQGFWPDGIYTAPTDDALKYDLQMEKTLGFNMVRKHIKVERQRWYYWADTLGILVWQDMPSCNSYTGNPNPPPVNALDFVAELTAMVTNHWNSPSIIMWDIFNEAQGQQNTGNGVGQTNTAYLVQTVKTLDPSRLVNQASGGNYYGVGDVFDQHSYPPPGDPTTTTQAPVDGEYGGIGFLIPGHLWNPSLAGGAYTGANTTNDVASIYDSFIDDVVEYKSASGLNAAVYTQITDVENECNGLMTYDRLLKPPLNSISASNQKAVSAYLYLTTVLPSSQNTGRTWTYTTNTPPMNWYVTNFSDASWNTGEAGFGTTGTPGAVVRTDWSTSDIWMRQTFTAGSLAPLNIANLVFYLYHDEDCEIYINGVLAGTASSYATSYVMLPMNSSGQNAIIPNGQNLIAVHCHNTTGGQDIDVGISERVLVMNALVVPTDYAGYWTLDETNGSIAHDSSGNSNDGDVFNGTWSPNGKVNGCLNFNGANSYVKLDNIISNDFSISFWLKTTQTGGTGQWWQGQCLVDGFVNEGLNDFGTSLSGNNFAFGTGNPDTTIISSAVVNDGSWHQCVATRQMASGTLSIYVDGLLQATGAAGTESLNAPAFLRFGSRQTGVNFFNGSLDDIRIYNRALGSNEVTALYQDSAFPAAAPTHLAATAGNNQVLLSWSDVSGVTGYHVKRSTTSGGPYSSIASVYRPNFTDSTAVNGTTYYYVAAAMNAIGDGTNSTEVNATPSFNSSLKTWFKADALAGLTNNARISDWVDSSGNGDDAIQTNAILEPTYVTNVIDGLPVVRFNAANSNALAFVRPVQDDFTIFCVFRSTQGFGSGSLYYEGAGLVNGEAPGVVNDFGSCLFANGQVCAGTGNPDVGVNSTTGFNDGHPHLMTFKRIENTGEIDLYMDSIFMGSTNGSTGSLTAPGQLALGAQQTLTYFFTGDIAEVKIFNSALTDSDRSAEESALECKYGIAGATTAPATPSGLRGTAGNLSILLSWSANAGDAAYNLSRSDAPNGPFVPLVSSQAATTYLDTNPVIGGTNYYEVAAINQCNMSANSPSVGVFLPASLILGLTAIHQNSLTISWPSWAGSWELQCTTNLTPPVVWLGVTNAVDSNMGQFSVTVPLDSGTRFFRLTAP